MPQPSPDLPPKLLCYEQLLDGCTSQLHNFAWPALDENTPCGLCYTSGTTGNPKV
jgi:fatty-acyl-CoA synthase